MQQPDDFNELAQQLGRAMLNAFKQMQQVPPSESVPPLDLPDTARPERDMLRRFSEDDPSGLHAYQVEHEARNRVPHESSTRLLDQLGEKGEVESRFRNREMDLIEDMMRDIGNDHMRLESITNAYEIGRESLCGGNEMY